MSDPHIKYHTRVHPNNYNHTCALYPNPFNRVFVYQKFNRVFIYQKPLIVRWCQPQHDAIVGGHGEVERGTPGVSVVQVHAPP